MPVEQNGQFVGVVVADIDLKAVQEYTEKISTSDAFYAVFTRKGTFVAHGTHKDYVLKSFYDAFPMTDAEIKSAAEVEQWFHRRE